MMNPFLRPVLLKPCLLSASSRQYQLSSLTSFNFTCVHKSRRCRLFSNLIEYSSKTVLPAVDHDRNHPSIINLHTSLNQQLEQVFIQFAHRHSRIDVNQLRQRWRWKVKEIQTRDSTVRREERHWTLIKRKQRSLISSDTAVTDTTKATTNYRTGYLQDDTLLLEKHIEEKDHKHTSIQDSLYEQTDKDPSPLEPNLLDLLSNESIVYSFHTLSTPPSSATEQSPIPKNSTLGAMKESDVGLHLRDTSSHPVEFTHHTPSLLQLLNENHHSMDNKQSVLDNSTIDNHVPMSKNLNLVQIDTNDQQFSASQSLLLQRGIALHSILSDKEWESCVRLTDTNIDSENTAHDSIADWMEPLLTQWSHRQVTLTTDHLNLLLLQISLSHHRNKLDFMLRIYQVMNEMHSAGLSTSSPNADTYFLLLSSLHKIGQASDIQSQIGLQMLQNIKTRLILLNPDIFRVGMKTFGSGLKRQYAEELLNLVLSEQGQGLEISYQDIFPLLSVYKEEHRMKSMLALIQTLLSEWKDYADFQTKISRVLLYCIALPTNTPKKIILQDSYLSYFKDMIEILNDSIYLPQKVWNQLLLSIYSLNKIEMKNERQLALLQQCCFRVFNHGSHDEKPNFPVLKIGLETAECMNDPQLATSILLWSITTKSEAKQGGPRTVAATVPESNKGEENSRLRSDPDKYTYVSPDALLRGLKLCVQNDRADLADQIWSLVKTEQYDLILPKELRSELQTMMITSYAQGGQSDKAENVLQEMRDQGTLFSDRPYAALIHALNEGGYLKEASDILEKMEKNEYRDDIQPNAHCYQVYMLSSLKHEEWSQVIDCSTRMIEMGITLDDTTTRCVLLASSHIGVDEMLHRVHVLVNNNVQFNLETFHLCLECLFPIIYQECTEIPSIDHIRHWFRLLSEKHPDLREESITLIKSLRIAEIEDGRKLPSRTTGANDKRIVLWQQVMRDLLYLYHKYTLNKPC